MITVAGLSPSLDLTYLVDSLALGAIHRPTEVHRCAGGKSLNMARAAATVGSSPRVVAILGGATGGILASMLRAADIEVVPVEAEQETRTCVSIASADTGQLTEVYENASAPGDRVWKEFVAEIASALVGRRGWLSISGSAPAGLDPDALAKLVRIGSAAGVRVAVDTHSSALPAAVEARPALVKINRFEAADLLDLPTDTDLALMAAAVRERSQALVILTDGSAGALGTDGTQTLQAQAPDLLGRFPVGSGDSFLGGLLASLEAGTDLGEAMRMGTACGVANALVPGPGQFELSSVLRIAPQVLMQPVR